METKGCFPQESRSAVVSTGGGIRRAIQRRWKIITLSALLATPYCAWSLVCTPVPAAIFSMPANLSAADIARLPVNAVIHRQSSVPGDKPLDFKYYCDTRRDKTYFVRPTGALVRAGVYQSSDPRVGIRATWGNKQLPFSGAITEVGVRPEFSLVSLPEKYALLVLELIKLADIDSPLVLSGPFAEVVTGGNLVTQQISFANPVVVVPARPTCRVATTKLTVTLGPTPAARFTGPGSTAGQTDFALELACQGGDANTRLNAFVTLIDATDPANTSEQLSLTRDSTARGIAIQILRNGTPVRHREQKWWAGQVVQGQGNLRIPLSARYVQTAQSVQPGSANARAIFTLSYE